jgi:DNA-binding response OmpR family regulator
LIVENFDTVDVPDILVASRDRKTREDWVRELRAEGFNCRGVSTVRQTQEALRKEIFKVAVVEDGLSGGDVLETWSRFVSHARPGLIFVGLDPCGERRTQVLSSGADHYLCRPVRSAEILHTVRNLMQRIDPGWNSGWTLDPLRWRLLAPNARSLRLTLKEKILLRALMERAGTPVPREELAWFLEADPRVKHSRGMEIMVRRLRKKMSDTLGLDAPLVTLHGVGYAFTAKATVLEEELVADQVDETPDGSSSANRTWLPNGYS